MQRRTGDKRSQAEKLDRIIMKTDRLREDILEFRKARKQMRNMIILMTIIFGLLTTLLIMRAVYHDETAKVNDSQEQKQTRGYEITTIIAYNNSLCSSTSQGTASNGFNAGMRITFKDKLTGNSIDGTATVTTTKGSGSTGSDSYYCEEEIVDEYAIISAYSQGYAPTVIKIPYQKDKLATVEILMVKSCSSGPSFFDNLKVIQEMQGQANDDTYVNDSKARVLASIQDEFGIDATKYTLTCIEADLGRGGYIKAKGTSEDGSRIDLYYRYGWCSSGGADCGFTKCLSTNSSNAFTNAKKIICNEITSAVQHDDYMCKQPMQDNTSDARADCMNGSYEQRIEDRQTISIIQDTNRCESKAIVGQFDCASY